MGNNAYIHLTVPSSLKGRWVRASRHAGQKLTDWIIDAVEAHIMAHAVIPDDLEFSDLRLERGPDGAVAFDWSPIERICEASGLDVSTLRNGPEDNVAGLIVAWYNAHRREGGDPDPVAEDLIGEVILEDAHGGGLSHEPGRG